MAINLYEAGGVITGSTAANEGDIDGTNTAFTLSLSGSLLTLTQSLVIDHGSADTYNGAYIEDLAQLGNDLVELVASVSPTTARATPQAPSITI